MGRFHRHDGAEHSHDDHHVHDHDHGLEHDHGHDHAHHDGHAHDRHAHDGHGHAQNDHLGDHSGYATGTERITVLERIFDENDAAAAANRSAFDAGGVRVVNLMSSPGAGKTTVLAATLAWCRDQGIRAGVVEGDIETSLDADRLAGFGAQIALLNTGDGFGGECHLDAPMVARALRDLDLDALDVVFVENVGNLVCPAEFDVGAHHSVMVYAITEGEEKPLKYPVMFRACELVLLNKVDLVPYLDADPDDFVAHLGQVNPQARVIPVTSRDPGTYRAWFDWLTQVVPGRDAAQDRSRPTPSVG